MTVMIIDGVDIGVDFRCYMLNMNKKDAVSLLNNSVLDNKGVL